MITSKKICGRCKPLKLRIFTHTEDGKTTRNMCDACFARDKKYRDNNKEKKLRLNAKYRDNNKETINKKNAIANAKRAEKLFNDKMKRAAKLARKKGKKKPMSKKKIEALARKIIVKNSKLLTKIKKERLLVYVALCAESTKATEPFKGATGAARKGGMLKLVKKEGPKKGNAPGPMELHKTFGFKAVSLEDFDYNEEASHFEKTIHRLLQHEFQYQKLWIVNGAGGGDPNSTNVSMSYGPPTGLVRHPNCNKVW